MNKKFMEAGKLAGGIGVIHSVMMLVGYEKENKKLRGEIEFWEDEYKKLNKQNAHMKIDLLSWQMLNDTYGMNIDDDQRLLTRLMSEHYDK